MMRYCLLSDIHGNIEALEAVIKAASKERIDEYLCLGDVIGYGADPSACIKTVRSLDPKALVAGNHEWGALGLLELTYFNEYARDALLWTEGILTKDELSYLKSYSLTFTQGWFTLVHGTLETPEEFGYIVDSYDAQVTADLMTTPLCFVGHSHVAGIFLSDKAGKMREIPDRNLKIDYGKKCIVNVGSIGQPRDGDPRASFAIYDEDAGVVEIKRIEYDTETAKKKILAAGLPDVLAYRILVGR